MIQDKYTRGVYRSLPLLGGLGLLAAAIFSNWPYDWSAFLSYLWGVLLACFLFFTWDLSLAAILGSQRPRPGLGYLLIMVRYGLLALLFYAMIALFAVRWDWFVAGNVTFVCALLLSALLSGNAPLGD